MKNIIIALLSLYMTMFGCKAYACEVCKKNQPELLQGITHGTGPQGQADYIIIWVAVVLVLSTLLFSLKYLIRPGESQPDHIKNSLFNQIPE